MRPMNSIKMCSGFMNSSKNKLNKQIKKKKNFFLLWTSQFLSLNLI